MVASQNREVYITSTIPYQPQICLPGRYLQINLFFMVPGWLSYYFTFLYRLGNLDLIIFTRTILIGIYHVAGYHRNLVVEVVPGALLPW